MKRISGIWIAMLIIYFFLLISTGFVTFVVNNEYATEPKNLKLLATVKTREELEQVRKVIADEIDNFDKINNLASQSFNVVLGGVLGFLSATATVLKKTPGSSKDEQPSET